MGKTKEKSVHEEQMKGDPERLKVEPQIQKKKSISGIQSLMKQL
jgi:hypothetical protein